MDFEEKGLVRDGFSGYNSGIKAFEMTNLEDASRSICNLN